LPPEAAIGNTGTVSRSRADALRCRDREADGNFSAYVPDLPGYVATGSTAKAVEMEIRDAVRFHIDGLKADGIEVPAPSSIADYVET
jgi:predicted RNase H-like HicB family nuclease